MLALALLLASAALPLAPSHGQSGNGLYEPFPEAAVKKRAQRYVEGLSSRTAQPAPRYSDARLAAGTFVDPDGEPAAPLRPAVGAGRASATERAGGGATGTEPALALQLGLIALVLAGIWAAVSTAGGGRTREA